MAVKAWGNLFAAGPAVVDPVVGGRGGFFRDALLFEVSARAANV